MLKVTVWLDVYERNRISMRFDPHQSHPHADDDDDGATQGLHTDDYVRSQSVGWQVESERGYRRCARRRRQRSVGNCGAY